MARTRVAPVAAASVGHNAAPSPIVRNAASALVRGRGVRDSTPGGAGGKCASSRRGLPRGGRRMPGHFQWAGLADVHDDDLLTVAAYHTSCPARAWGTEYCPPSKVTIGVFDPTVRITPSAAVKTARDSRSSAEVQGSWFERSAGSLCTVCAVSGSLRT